MGSWFSSSVYGDIMKVDTTGASSTTAQENNLTLSGELASHTMAKDDLEKMKQYKTIIKEVASEQNVDAAVIAAIISRESRAGRTLTNGCGTLSNRWGLMQVKENPQGTWNSKAHLRHGTQILVGCFEAIRKKCPDWKKKQQLKGGIAAYNVGVQSIHSYNHLDEYTTGGDYSNDVVARAQWYKRNGVF